MKNISTYNRKAILIIALLSLSFSYSQDLYVGSNTYIYSEDLIFVTDDIELNAADSNMFFRGDTGHLVQETNTTNSGLGEVSFYQEQDANPYAYNYWCSPVGVVTAAPASNENFSSSNLHAPADATDYSNTSSTTHTFTSNLTAATNELSSRWIYSLKDGEGYAHWIPLGTSGTVDPGYGFTLKGSGTTENVLDFRGRPNNGTINISCTFDGTDSDTSSGLSSGAETLTGNPYPSPLDLKDFIKANISVGDGGTGASTVINGNILFWEQNQISTHYTAEYEGGYSTYTPGDLADDNDNGSYAQATFKNYENNGGISGSQFATGNGTDFSGNYSRRYAAVGQGFVIQSNGSGGTVTFNNSMRQGMSPTTPTNIFNEDSSSGGSGAIFAKQTNSKNEANNSEVISSFKKEENSNNKTVIPEIKIHTQINEEYYRENVIAFRKNTPNNNTFNMFFDAKNTSNLGTDVFLISSNELLVIKSINYSASTRIPLGFKVENDNTNFSMNIVSAKHVPEDVNMFVYDNVNSTYTDITSDGTFDITLDKGTFYDRFEITFVNIDDNSLAINEATNTLKDINVIINNTNKELQIINEEQLNIKSLSVIDVSGKMLINDTLNSSNSKYTYSTKSLNTGVYLVNIETTNSQILTKKIIVH